MSAEQTSFLTTEILALLANSSADDAVQLLAERKLDDADTMLSLATLALTDAETDPELAEQWLEICIVCNRSIGSALLDAQIAYVQARLALQQGDLNRAEQNIVQAQAAWQGVGDTASIARSNLGLTQILAMQGRYDEAQNAIQQAIDYFEQIVRDAKHELNSATLSAIFRLIGARRNLANLYSYQDRHEAAVAEFAKVNSTINQIQPQLATDSEEYQNFQYERAHIAISESLSFAHLDQISVAESTLLDALQIFSQQKDSAYRIRVYGNLGSLYLRMGRYADALSAFEQVGDEQSYGDADHIAADEQNSFGTASILLEQATTYIALNLLPEAESFLRNCEEIFRGAGSLSDDEAHYPIPHELGGTLFALGQVYVRQESLNQADSVIREAEQIFESIDNEYWMNRCRLAMAALAYLQDEKSVSITLLDKLLAVAEVDERTQTNWTVTAWDIGLLTDSRLLRLRIHIDQGEIVNARQLVSQIESSITLTTEFSHLRLRFVHAQGLIAHAMGDYNEARRLFLQAIELLEEQRATLIIEEVRSAFIIDKTDLYTDMVINLLSILDTQGHDKIVNDISNDATNGDELIAEAFAVIERARSRTLLERLIATLPSDATDPSDQKTVEGGLVASEQLNRQSLQRETLRRELHWLYNRLLGQGGVRRMDIALTQQIQSCEDELQKLEWQTSSALQQAEPVALNSLQQALALDQQAIAYYIANDEIMAFVVSQTDVHFEQRICTKQELLSALRDFRFQLGRFQIGCDYVERHAVRLKRGIDGCLAKLCQLLISPLLHYLTMERLLIIPFGATHLVPFHALRTENSYLIERFECSYAPSASIAVMCQQHEFLQPEFSSLAALGITDELIPEARVEIERIAQHFDTAHTYLDERANRANLNLAASQADILHIATHGLYRSDNPFFSSLKLADGWIDVREIYRLPLRARLVVLSTCESGSGYVQAGDEVIGLARGFLGAGAHALLVSMWNLHDTTAAQQMDRFYDALKNHDDCERPASALRKTQLEAIAQGDHPYYWAPFAVVG